MSIWDDDSDEWRELMKKAVDKMSHTERLLAKKRIEYLLNGEATLSQQEIHAAMLMDMPKEPA